MNPAAAEGMKQRQCTRPTAVLRRACRTGRDCWIRSAKQRNNDYDFSNEQGRGLWVVNGEAFEAGAGDILIIKAGEIHGFKCTEGPLVQLDVHLSPRFIQEYPPDV